MSDGPRIGDMGVDLGSVLEGWCWECEGMQSWMEVLFGFMFFKGKGLG